MSDTDRAGYITGLRELADLLEQTPDLPLPSSPSINPGGSTISWYLFGGVEPLALAEQKARAAEIVRTIPGSFDKYDTGDLFRFRGRIGGLPAEVIVDRPAVCERVVTGTREVTREVPDPVTLADVPTVTVTEVVEDVRWECRPLLAEANA